MINAKVQFNCQLARFIFIAFVIALIAACTGTVDEEAGGTTGSNTGNVASPGNNISNTQPIAFAGTNRGVTSGEPITISGSGFDLDIGGSITSYLWTQRDGPSINLINQATASVSFTAPVVSSKTFVILRLTVTDNQGASNFDDVAITVFPTSGSDSGGGNSGGGNSAPLVNAGRDLTATEGDSVSITGTASDSDGSISSYQWTRLDGININLSGANTPTVQFNAPTVTSPSNITLRFTVADNLGASAFDDVVVSVIPAGENLPPVANAGSNVTMAAGATISLNGSASSDPDGTINSYRWQRLSGANVSLSGSSNPTVQVTAPNVTATSPATLRLTVTDDLGASASDDVVLTIVPNTVNAPPLANAGADQVVNIEEPVTLQGSGSDTDGNIAGYQWSQTGGPNVTLANATTANAGFNAPNVTAATALTFQLLVIDNGGEVDTDEVVVTVYPLVTISGNITTASGTLVDSDVNDTSAAYAANNSFQQAQFLFNPVVVGGYVNLPGQGPIGRSSGSGDIDDYYSINMAAGQVITLYIGDSSNGDLDLYLWDQNQQLVDSSLSPNGTESLSVPSAGNYFINVRAASGASNYVLSVGLAGAAVQSNGWRLSDDFQTGDIIVQFDDSSQTTGNRVNTLSSRASSVGLQAKAGAPGRSMLLGLGNVSQRAAAFNRLAIKQATTGNVSPSLQDKLDTLLAAKSLSKRADVNEVSLNYRYYPTLAPNDANYGRQWHYPSINLPQAWDITTGSSDVIVAVIDTGVLLNHPDLQGQLVPGYDFIADNANSGDGQPGIDSDPNDPGDGGNNSASSFHGTHVAGTIAAASNNSTGVAGIAWGAKIMPCRAIGINGGLRYDIEQCVRFASGLSNDSGTVPAQPADIINLSLGGPTNTTNAPAAYRNARSQGVIVIAAAGNDSSNQLFAPAAYNGVVSVSATNISRRLASYSNFGSTIDVAAPGGDSGDLNGDGFFDGVYSTAGDDSSGRIVFNYRFAAGTSMASPHMAGVVALMKSVYPGLTPDILDSMLANGELTDDLGNPGRDNSFGYGIINAQKAVSAAANAATPTPTPPPPQPAALQVSPTSINFGATLTTSQFTVSNAGSGTLDITSITDDAGGWLSVSPSTVDATGLGSYDVSVSHAGLLEGLYTATITIMSSAGTQTIAVNMQVNAVATNDDAGFHYIQLLDMETMEIANQITRTSTNGVYQYTFPGVRFGTYHVRAGSDLDKDGIVCELGDACGAYPTLDIISRHIIVDETAQSLTGLDFITDFRVNLTTQQ